MRMRREVSGGGTTLFSQRELISIESTNIYTIVHFDIRGNNIFNMYPEDRDEMIILTIVRTTKTQQFYQLSSVVDRYIHEFTVINLYLLLSIPRLYWSLLRPLKTLDASKNKENNSKLVQT